MYFLDWASHNEELAVTSLVAASLVTVFTLGMITSTIRQIWLGHRQLELKQSMVDQGMSVEEIERVLKS